MKVSGLFKHFTSSSDEQRLSIPGGFSPPVAARRSRKPHIVVPLEVVREMASLNEALVKASMAGAQKTTLQRQRILDVVQMERQIHEAAARNGAHSRKTAESTQKVAEETERGHQSLEAATRSMHEMDETLRQVPG